MRLPTIRGVIRRRLLLNYRVDPDVMARHLPERFEPVLHRGKAIAGICLIRLEEIRPRGAPRPFGVSSENAAHRVAVRWSDANGPREGVFIARRDTGSLLNRIAGGRLFPGEHHPARFVVEDDGARIALSMHSADGMVSLDLRARSSRHLAPSSSFDSIEQASRFFEQGAVGYSVTADPRRLDGVRLVPAEWTITPLEVDRVRSSYFSDSSLFPEGSVEFDCGLLMRGIEHEWRSERDLTV